VIIRRATCVLLCIMAFTLAETAAQSLQPNILAQFEQKTGLTALQIPGTEGAYLGKTHRGYGVIFTAKAGNVWGRYAARLTMGEIGRETGGVAAYLTGQRNQIGSTVVGSPLDNLLSQYLGQPLSIAIILTHSKPNAPRLDVLSEHSRIGPEDRLPQREKVGSNAGFIYATDGDFAKRIEGNAALMKRMKNMRCQYVRLDQGAVSFFFAGTEVEYSGMIRDHGDYYKMLNDLMDDLADIADAIPSTA
jgi:hypothetical protein